MSMPMGDGSPFDEIVGRTVERQRLSWAIERLSQGRGNAIVMIGEPGIGKSTLLAAAAVQARAGGFPAFVLRSPYDFIPAGPALVLVDDLHFAPAERAPEIDILLSLSTRCPLLLLFAYRPRQMACKVGSVLSRAIDSGILSAHTLAGLTLPQARQLLGARDDLEQIYRDSGGNPLYLQALAEPDSAAAVAVISELSELTAPEVQIVETAAILGDPFTAGMLTSLAPASAVQSTAALDRLVAMDVVRATDSASHLSFRHPVLARSIYDRIDISRRQSAHRRIAAVLEAARVPAAQRAHHVAQSFEPTRPQHVETLLAGARELLESDPHRAAAWLAIAGAAITRHDPRWVEAHLLLARAQLLRGSPQESHRVLHHVVPHADLADLTAAAAVHYGQTDRLLGRPKEARARFEAGLAVDGSADTQVLHTELADLGLETADHIAAIHHATKAVRVACVDGDEAAEAGARSLAALAQMYSGNTPAARDNTAQAARLVDGLPDAALIRNLASLNRLGMTESALELLTDAERHLARGLRLSRHTGQMHIIPDLLKTLADVLLRQGKLAQALDTILEARHAAEHILPLAALVETMYAETLLWLDTSRATEEVIAAAERAIRMCTGFTETWAIVGQVSSADILIRAGQPDRGSRLLTRAAGGQMLPGLAPARRTRWWESLVWAASTQGDSETAEHLAQQAAAVRAVHVPAARSGYLSRIQMHLAGLRADIGSVQQHAQAARQAFTSTHMRLEACRSLADSARHCLRAGASSQAIIEQLDEAQDLALYCGSLRLLEDIEQIRGQITKPPGAILTDREWEIANLARTGMRSKDIAKNLFVSVRTIDTHLSRIYRKLGISTRAELAGLLRINYLS